MIVCTSSSARGVDVVLTMSICGMGALYGPKSKVEEADGGCRAPVASLVGNRHVGNLVRPFLSLLTNIVRMVSLRDALQIGHLISLQGILSTMSRDNWEKMRLK